MNGYQKIILIVILIVATGGSFLFGVSVGYENRSGTEKITSLFNKEDGIPATVDFAPFWKTWNLLNEKYVTNDTASDQEKVYGAIQGLVSSLGDPYTVFFPPAEAEQFETDIRGEFQGVGMEIGMRDSALTVIAPLKGTPAERAGIRSGDQIIKIDDTVTSDLTIDKAVSLIRGEKGTAVKLTIVREGEGEPLILSVVRDVITIPTIDTEIRNEQNGTVTGEQGTVGDTSEIFVIRLYNFSAQSSILFRESLRSFVLSGKHKLILDLRGNPGGYLESAVDMASWFLPAGKVVVREEFAQGEEGSAYRSRGYNIFNDNLEMVILVNGGSASASEILAGALSEHGVAKLVGTQTFGKGSVQELVPITDNTALKITIARWLTPNGVSISKQGLTPDVVVEITKEDMETGKDTQMERAVELLSE